MKRKVKLSFVLILVFFMCLLIKNLNTFSIYRDTLNSKLYLSVLDPTQSYTIDFASEGGDLVSDVYSRYLNDEIGPLPTTTRAGYNFIGWYKTDGTKVTPYTLVTGSETLHAHWEKIVCKKAVANTLHTETCKSDGSCISMGYTAESTITYGTIPNNNSPIVGDAYDCDVNDDGVYDPLTERFYYVRKDTSSEEKAVLVHFTSFDVDGQMDSDKSRGSYAYDLAQTYLPDTTTWSNSKLTSYNGKAARFIQLQDLYESCGGSAPGDVRFTTCQFYLETSRFQSDDLGRAGIWIEKPTPTSSSSNRIQTKTLSISPGDNNTARPVIEIPFNTIDGYKEKVAYSVTFVTLGGSEVAPRTVYENETLGEPMPTPTKEGYSFGGWYSDPDYHSENLVTGSTPITGTTVLYAKWEEVQKELEYVFRIPGTCTFAGENNDITSDNNNCISTINPTNTPIDYTSTPHDYIDTGVALYSHDNIGKDYEIGFTIDHYLPSENVYRATIMNTKKEETGYPGVVFRRDDSSNLYILQARNTSAVNYQFSTNYTDVTSVVIYRQSGAYYYSINGGTKVLIGTPEYNPEFNLTTWFGAGPSNAAGTSAQRHLVGKISNMYIKLETDSITKYNVEFNAHGGTASFVSKEVNRGEEVGELPTVSNPGYYFDGWYTAPSGGTKVTTSTIISANTTFHAQYKDIYLVSFHGEGGTVSPHDTIDVVDGESIGTTELSNITATQSGYIFDGWYTAPSGGTRVDGTEIISADTDYYAHWKPRHTVILNGEGGTVTPSNTIEVADGESIGASVLNQYTATKTGGVFDGWYTAASGGTKITGNEIITGNVTYHAQYVTTCKINYDGNGAEPDFSTKTVDYGQAIGAFPLVERFNYTLDGWYIDDGTFTTQVDENTTVTANTNLIAKWTFTDYAAAIGNTGYATIQAAINAVPENGSTATTVRILKNITNQAAEENNNNALIYVDNGRKVILDLEGHTVSTKASGNPKTLLINSGTVELTNGTVTTPSNQGTVEIVSGATFKSYDVTIANTSNKAQAVYNNGGIVYIEDGSIITNTTSASGNTRRAAVHNAKNGGTIYITGGTITSINYNAVYNENGSLVIGTSGGDVSKTTPTIIGKKYGVMAVTTYEFYDGIIKGETGAVGIGVSSGGYNPPTSEQIDTGETKISNYETGAIKVNDIDGNYKVLYLDYDTNKYKISLDPRGGQITGSSIIQVEPTDPIGALPTPTKGVYTFVGWYDLATDNPVNDSTVPTGDMDLYALWNYTPTHETFNLINDVERVYYNNIATWKSTEATFQTNMDNNFHANSCLECDGNNSTKPYNNCDNPYNGTIQCDKPKGFVTGVNDSVNVYTAVQSGSTYTKGTQVTYVTTTSDGTIYDMIPGQTYYWELASDSNIYGTVSVSGERRILEAGSIRNIRDLGGLEVDTNNDGTIDGVIDYGRMLRGPKLNSQADVTSLQTLGVTKEVDLRGTNSDPKLSNYIGREIRNYEISPNFNNGAYYNQFRQAVSDTIDDILADENIYFHCAIGTDRTGTMAWFLEGLLGVSEEDRVEDYELSYFYGLLNRHRFYSTQAGTSINNRFTYMYQTYQTNQDIYNYYTNNGTENVQQVQAFRDAVINYY